MLKLGEQRIPTQDKQSRIIDEIEDRGPIDLTAVDYTMDNPPEVVRQKTGPVIYYFYNTEGDVGKFKNDVFALLPNAPTETVRFANAWQAEESNHAVPFGTVLDMIGVERPALDDNNISPSMIKGGKIGEFSQNFHDMSELAYYIQGATQEGLTMAGYRFLYGLASKVISKNFVATAIMPTQKQEPSHAEWYEGEALRKASEMPAWEVFTVKKTLRHFWTPVGANTPEQRQRFAIVTRMLINHKLGIEYDGPAELSPAVSEADLKRFTSPIQETADVMMNAKARSSELSVDPNILGDAVEKGDWTPLIGKFILAKEADTPKPGKFILKRLLKLQNEYTAHQREIGIVA
jgi:hypothetical protein